LLSKNFLATTVFRTPGSHLDKWVRSAFAQRSQLGKKESLNLLDLREHLIRLLEAAQLLNDDPANEEKALRLTADDATLMNTALYYHPQKKFPCMGLLSPAFDPCRIRQSLYGF